MFFQNFWCITWESLSQVPGIVQPLANIVEFKVPNRRWLSLQLCPRYQTSRRFHHVVDLWPCGKVESFARWNFERKADLLGDISANAARGKPLRLFFHVHWLGHGRNGGQRREPCLQVAEGHRADASGQTLLKPAS